MIVFGKVRKKEAEKTRQKLLNKNLMKKDIKIEKDEENVFFPLKKKVNWLETVEMEGKKLKEKPKSLEQALEGVLTKEEQKKLVTSFDVIGDIAIIEVPNELETREKQIGKAVLETQSVKTVRKKGKHTGKFRTMKTDFLAGKDREVTVHKEHGVRMKVNVDETYFSPRLSHERKKIAEKVSKGEKIAGFFAGVGPFPLVIAKDKDVTVFSVELNPRAFELMEENIGMNKSKGEIKPIHGDVNEVVNDLPECDRVLMPLPKGGEDFLDSAFKACKKGGTVHFYQFEPDEDHWSKPLEKIHKQAGKTGREVEIVEKKVVRPHAPHVDQVRIDFKVF